jgi:hypothetical protein
MNNFNISIEISSATYETLPGKYHGKELYSLAGISCDNYMLLLDVAEEIDVPINPEDIIILTGEEKFVVSKHCTELSSNPKLVNPVPFKMNGIHYDGQNGFSNAKITTEELLVIIGQNDTALRFILDLDGVADQVIPAEHEIVVGSNWRLLTTPITNEDECIDIEDCCDDITPPANYYRIKVNDSKYKVDVPHMLGRDILLLSNVDNPSQHSLYQMFKGGETKIVELCEKVDFTAPGVERFTTIPLDMTEGLNARRDFQLSEADGDFLNSMQSTWEAVIEGNIRRIIIHDFPLPSGYTAETTMLNMRLEASYPDTQIDMAYFFPAISRANNKPIKAITTDQFDGKQWQRWSRHRTASNPWRPGIDNISTHVAAIKSWFIQELVK